MNLQCWGKCFGLLIFPVLDANGEVKDCGVLPVWIPFSLCLRMFLWWPCLKSFAGPLTMSEREVFQVWLFGLDHTSWQGTEVIEAVEVEPFLNGASAGWV